uniref:Uncharacterized protein n=1 Tax=Oryza glumipatula TaxID=40148 RepID=A0A0E0AHK8_9ORYZ
MASVGFGTTVAPAVAAGRRLSHRRAAAAPPSARVARPSATKSVTAAAATEKGLFDAIFGALYKEEQLLETDPILNKVEEKAPAAASRATKAGGAPAKKAAGDGDGDGGFSFGGLFSKKE